MKKAEVDNGKRAGVPTDMAEKLKALERENRELRQANEILRKASAYFAQAELDRRVKAMIAFIDDHRAAYGVEPICKVLPIAPSTYFAHVAQRIEASKRSARARRDGELKAEVQRASQRTSASTARGRSGGSCGEKALRSPAAPSSG
jgi:putative transposase